MIPAALLGCAPNVAPVTLEAIIKVESGGDPLAIHVNGSPIQPPPARDAKEASRIAARFIARGYSVDLGLMQVNSRNLAALGVTVEQGFDPCTNIRSGAAILAADYGDAARALGEGQPALRAALSAYNTGDFHRGFENGYIARYYGSVGVPALAGDTRTPPVIVPAKEKIAPAPPNPYTSDTNAFEREPIDVRIE
jgi:type IV secretion system protein VirB1